jgi:hypothetical protein
MNPLTPEGAHETPAWFSSFETKLDARLDKIAQRLTDIESEIADIKRRSQSQDLRLSAIESFPPLQLHQPPRLYATEDNSVSLPRRVRVGAAG